MKRVLNYLIAIVLVSITIFSCLPNPCKQRAVDCKNGGTCKDGDCICAEGYEGDSCQFTANLKFAGRYACVLTSTLDNGAPYYNDDTIVIKTGATRSQITFYSVRDSLINVLNANVVNTTISIPKQDFNNLAVYSVQGTGSLNKEILEITSFQTITAPIPGSRKTTYVGYKIK